MTEHLSGGTPREPDLSMPVQGIHDEICAVRKEQRESEARRRPIEIATLAFLAATALFTVLTFVVFWLQLRTFKGQLDEARLATTTAHDDANRALIASNRPWLGFHSIKMDPPKAGAPVVVRVSVEDFGHSPAFGIRSITRVLFRRTSEGQPPSPSHKELPAHSYVMFPAVASAETALTNGRSLTEAEADDIAQGRMTVWIVSRVEYRDIEGNQYYGLTHEHYNPKTQLLNQSDRGNEGD
jgi:hypothetical protein